MSETFDLDRGYAFGTDEQGHPRVYGPGDGVKVPEGLAQQLKALGIEPTEAQPKRTTKKADESAG